ncbi:DUF1919 domain-containing protein [Clostridium perfringens]|uniref:DUF1919 domain-containing protein n=1 Tax=Clostridium perfringens TaxID=1502 RepID=UPI001898EDE1|nr:DUF1919 domain-containing protein [Clostridium perfringens]MDM0445791.1 DUF1919 domain-containing protein [Clostridium perfringens]MDM0451526.1 DUF1919 domain-containing protein [Clostridium perfringens]
MFNLNYIKRKIIIGKNRFNLRNKNFTIISNNCWGGFVYNKFGIKYNSPFVGLFMYAQDYINLLERFDSIDFFEIKFIDIEESKYKKYIKGENRNINYPIGLIDDDLEIHFLHYKSKEEAIEKWTRRAKRINYENLIFKFSDRDLCTPELIYRFEKLNFKNKICFTAKEYRNYKSCIQIKEFKDKEFVEFEWMYYERYVDIKKYLNKYKIGS